ncbi:hypothetical protein BWQ96_05217 [Gracilariopsis chorda]|uniref:Uncharacterized protein n=1 Tax=Gracilariopsis chorda TaxID=448386 RepID=A0A2V3ISD5_9FLOR|nr:hypothetical protein BWQ96_05217 [Gracilariopsis chorda]|eukprot:PXF45014.1 hypothetical protein BWQ96_05217 [Gracilariopsis chorda]
MKSAYIITLFAVLASVAMADKKNGFDAITEKLNEIFSSLGGTPTV